MFKLESGISVFILGGLVLCQYLLVTFCECSKTEQINFPFHSMLNEEYLNRLQASCLRGEPSWKGRRRDGDDVLHCNSSQTLCDP